MRLFIWLVGWMVVLMVHSACDHRTLYIDKIESVRNTKYRYYLQ